MRGRVVSQRSSYAKRAYPSRSTIMELGGELNGQVLQDTFNLSLFKDHLVIPLYSDTKCTALLHERVKIK